MENHNIVIIGMPGSGKTTFGTALAEALGRDFYDADTYLETSEGRTIKELFAVSEDCFRDAETRTARALGSKKGVVIATGGGVIKRRENIDIYKENGHRRILLPMWMYRPVPYSKTDRLESLTCTESALILIVHRQTIVWLMMRVLNMYWNIWSVL